MYFFGLRNYVSSYSFYFILDIVASSYLLSTTVDPSIILVFNSLFNSYFEYLLHPFCTSVHISHLLKVSLRLEGGIISKNLHFGIQSWIFQEIISMLLETQKLKKLTPESRLISLIIYLKNRLSSEAVQPSFESQDPLFYCNF